MANYPKRQRNSSVRTRARRARRRACAGCGSPDNLQLDHIIPLAEGGPDTFTNTQWLCSDACHPAKTQAERQRGIDRARAQRGSLSKKYRDLEPHPGAAQR